MGEALSKDRKEEDTWASQFGSSLPSGESIQSVDDVTIAKHAVGSWVDVSSEFGGPGGTKDGDNVQFTLGAAAANDEQLPREFYMVFVQITTSQNRKIINTHRLRIASAGDVDLSG